jgi:hypothetical protein
MKAYACAWFVDCECGEGIPNKDGSYMWIPEVIPEGRKVKCPACGRVRKLPAAVQ